MNIVEELERIVIELGDACRFLGRLNPAREIIRQQVITLAAIRAQLKEGSSREDGGK